MISLHFELLVGCPNRKFLVKVDPKLPFWGKNRKIGKFSKKAYNHVSIFKIHVVAMFHEEILIFDEIRGHLVILPIYRAQTRDSEDPL